MNLTSLITDNVTEILIKIIEFTQARQKILARNITSFHLPGFVPEELEVNEFSSLISDALNKHALTQQLILRDTKHIKFGCSGSFEVKPITDKHSKELLDESQDEYIKFQINKLWENSLNQKLAAELLRQRQGIGL
jgi:flagellar basal body rod protein FlgB